MRNNGDGVCVTQPEAGIVLARARLNRAEVKVAAQAKRERWPILARGSYFAGGETVVRLAAPDSWRSCYLAKEGIVEVNAVAYDATEPGQEPRNHLPPHHRPDLGDGVRPGGCHRGALRSRTVP